MPCKRFSYIWKYTVKEDRLDEFEKAYGSEGDWVQLFRKADGYISTMFYRDNSDDLTFITIDTWESKAHRDAFRKKYADEFNRLDLRCESLTERELWIGDFDQLC